MRHTPRTILAGLALTALVACADEPTSAPEDTAAPATEEATTPTSDAATTPAADDATTPAADAEAVDAVDIDDFAYRPEAITVPAGTEVTWTNVDAVLHSVTAGTPDEPDEAAFDLEVDEAGQTVSHTFEEPGTHEYFCRYHDFMLGTVEVTG